jgi:hypothetical protein
MLRPYKRSRVHADRVIVTRTKREIRFVDAQMTFAVLGMVREWLKSAVARRSVAVRESNFR